MANIGAELRPTSSQHSTYRTKSKLLTVKPKVKAIQSSTAVGVGSESTLGRKVLGRVRLPCAQQGTQIKCLRLQRRRSIFCMNQVLHSYNCRQFSYFMYPFARFLRYEDHSRRISPSMQVFECTLDATFLTGSQPMQHL